MCVYMCPYLHAGIHHTQTQNRNVCTAKYMDIYLNCFV